MSGGRVVTPVIGHWLTEDLQPVKLSFSKKVNTKIVPKVPIMMHFRKSVMMTKAL